MLVNQNGMDYNILNSHYLGFELLVPGKQTYGSFLKAIEQEGTYTEEQFKSCSIILVKWWMNRI